MVRYTAFPPLSGRIIIASDGLWDAIGNDKAARTTRGKPAQEAARHLVKVRRGGCCNGTTQGFFEYVPPESCAANLLQGSGRLTLRRIHKSRLTISGCGNVLGSSVNQTAFAFSAYNRNSVQRKLFFLVLIRTIRSTRSLDLRTYHWHLSWRPLLHFRRANFHIVGRFRVL